MSQTVIQYVLGRLKELGVSETFGIPGLHQAVNTTVTSGPLE